MKRGDTVVYSGPVVNADWTAGRRGTIINVTQSGLIDIKWDHGPTNYGHNPRHFTVVKSANPEGAEHA